MIQLNGTHISFIPRATRAKKFENLGLSTALWVRVVYVYPLLSEKAKSHEYVVNFCK